MVAAPSPSEGDVNCTPQRAAWQRERLDDASRELLARDSAAFLHQSVSTPCLAPIVKAEGLYIEDMAGRRYLDFHGNNVHHLGHGHAEVIAAIKAQLDELSFAPRRYAPLRAVQLAEMLGERFRELTGEKGRVLFTTGGSDAVEVALKLARAATGRFKTLSFWDAFHGAGFGAASVGGEALFRSGRLGPLLPGAEHVAPFGCYRCAYGHPVDAQGEPDLQCCRLACASMVRYVLEREGDVAAVIAEPARAVPYLPPPGYWQAVREACHAHGTLLIFDEIPTGLGKTGRFFAAEHDAAAPDIVGHHSRTDGSGAGHHRVLPGRGSIMSSRPSVIDRPQREAMRIAGDKVFAERTIDVRYPWTGEVVATVPKATVDDVRRALKIAHGYKPTLTRHERYRILMKAGDLIAARRDEIARLITLESGLCLKDTLYEVGRASDVLLFAAQQALVDDGQSFSCDLTHHGKSRRVHTMREPMLGVISAITPFNHPLNQVIHKVAPAVATNNRMLLKPSEKTPLAALLLADVLYEAGLPPPMLSVITGDPKEIADEMLTHQHVDVVTFTGGVAIGKTIAAKAVYKRQILELGGNDPLVVMDDADIAKAAELAASGSYKNSGQRCTAVKRIFVHQKVADEFTEALLARTRAWTYGDPLDPAVDMGTVIDERSAMLFERRVDAAVAQGARLLHGNRRDGASYGPTLIDRARGEMEVVQQETFGPVSPVITFNDVDDAIRQVNSTAYGLSSGLCSNRLDDIMRFVRELNVGSVNVWEVPGYRLEVTPFGGIKDSGTGIKEGVQECCKAFTNVKTYSLPW